MRIEPQSLGPFYPCQIATGETFVVDNRTQSVVWTAEGSFDTVERWIMAKKRAGKLNADLWNRRRVMANRLKLGTLVLLMVVLTVALFAIN